MLAIGDFLTNIREWAKNKDWKSIRISSTKRLEAKGYIDLGSGSYFRFIHKEWFDKAVKEGIIIKSKDGKWLPIIEMEESYDTVARRGRDVVKKNVHTRISSQTGIKLREFNERYETWKSQQKQMDIEFEGLIKTFDKAI
jgi:hypothetical protein